MQTTAMCSLCGRDTGIEVGEGPRAEWYLCADCEGTPEAEEAGYSHAQKAKRGVAKSPR